MRGAHQRMFDRILKTVNTLIGKYGLLHPSALAERCGLFVLRVPYRRVHGVSLSLGGLRVVAIDPSLPIQRQNGALLHETGHQVLHPGTVGFFVEANPFERPTKYELEAHLFALLYALRWDRWGFEECGCDVFRFAGMYGLPHMAAEVAVWNLGKLREFVRC